MDQDHARHLLDRIGVLRHPCDLDLLVFFARHPRALMTSEHLAALMGYGLQQTAESLDLLLKAGLLIWTQNPTRAARMYVFTASTKPEWLPPLLELASTRHGRLAIRRALARPPGRRTDGRTAPAESDAAGSHGTRPFMVRQRAEATQEPWADERRMGGLWR